MDREAATAGAKNRSAGRVFARQVNDGRADRLGCQHVEDFFGQQAVCHCRTRCRRQAVHANVVLGTFEMQRIHKANHRHFRGAVICLAEIAVKARTGGRKDDTAVLSFAHDFPHCFRAVHAAHQVYFDNEPEFIE